MKVIGWEVTGRWSRRTLSVTVELDKTEADGWERLDLSEAGLSAVAPLPGDCPNVTLDLVYRGIYLTKDRPVRRACTLADFLSPP